MTPPNWIDVARDLDAAVVQVEEAVQGDRDLRDKSGRDRRAYELAIGKHLHDAYSAAERAIERIIELLDGDLPAGRHFHQDLIARAASAIEGVRPPVISASLAEELGQLLRFRHAYRHTYGAFLYDRAAPNVALAAAVIPRLRDEVTAFAAGLGLAPRA